MISYVAFLRGINVGGRKVFMEDLQNCFVSHGFSTVKTLIASGNVIFASEEKDEEKLRLAIEQMLLQKFGFPISVILRTTEEIESLLEKKPFSSAKIEKGTRLQITLFSDGIESFDLIKRKDFA